MNRCALSSALMLATLLAALPARSAEPTKQQCVDANDAGQDLRRTGKLRQAREKFALCATSSCPAIVREDCGQRLMEIDAAMPTIVFEAKDAAGSDIASVKVTMDGQPFAEHLDGTPLQLDPGEHRFAFNVRGRLTETVIVVREGDKARHERVVLGSPVQAPLQAPIAPAKEEPRASREPASDGNAQRMVGMVLGGAGVVGVAVGSILGLVSKATYDHAFSSECGSNANTCSAQGAQDGQTAHGQATASTVSFVAGLALLGGGAVLYFTAPHGLSAGPTVGSDGAGLQVRGAW
jgi:hypothetical protein